MLISNFLMCVYDIYLYMMCISACGYACVCVHTSLYVCVCEQHGSCSVLDVNSGCQASLSLFKTRFLLSFPAGNTRVADLWASPPISLYRYPGITHSHASYCIWLSCGFWRPKVRLVWLALDPLFYLPSPISKFWCLELYSICACIKCVLQHLMIRKQFVLHVAGRSNIYLKLVLFQDSLKMLTEVRYRGAHL